VASLDKLAKDRETTKYIPSRFGKSFTVEHYAGAVEYTTQGWLETNRDPLSEGLVGLLASSSDPFIASMFADTSTSPDPSSAILRGSRRGIKSGVFRTVSQRHREQLASLMRQLRSTEPHFVRCILPNSDKVPGRFDVPLVLDQLRCNGVVEGIRISRLGFPNRTNFADFVERYSCLDPNATTIARLPSTRDGCKALVRSLNLDPGAVKIGVSKLFLKAGILADLDERRETFLSAIFVGLQATVRRLLAVRELEERRRQWRAAVVVQRRFRERQRWRKSRWGPLLDRVMSKVADERTAKWQTTVGRASIEVQKKPGSSGGRPRHDSVRAALSTASTPIFSRAAGGDGGAQLQELIAELAAAREQEAKLREENKKLRKVRCFTIELGDTNKLMRCIFAKGS
jgi:myosin protein heavy chain